MKWFAAFSLILVAVLLFLPRAVRRGKAPLSLTSLGYFSLIGFGFMVLEIVLLRKFSLVLGHPVLSLSVTLFSLLVYCGIGSRVSQELSLPPRRIIIIAGLSISLLVLFLRFGLGSVLPYIVPLPLWGRIVATSFLILPLGFFLGMPFPSGVAHFHKSDDRDIPWIWAVNGASSITGSMVAFLAALNYGFKPNYLCTGCDLRFGGSAGRFFR